MVLGSKHIGRFRARVMEVEVIGRALESETIIGFIATATLVFICDMHIAYVVIIMIKLSKHLPCHAPISGYYPKQRSEALLKRVMNKL